MEASNGNFDLILICMNLWKQVENNGGGEKNGTKGREREWKDGKEENTADKIAIYQHFSRHY